MKRVYFDNAATTAVAPEVIETMTHALQNLYGNPSSIHADGRVVRAAIEEARKSIAHKLNAGIGEVFFTSGGTESNNMILKNAVRDLGVRRFITSALEHHAVLHTLETLRKSEGVEVIFLKIDAKGRIDLRDLSAHLSQNTEGVPTLVSLMHANNEIGTMTDLEVVGNLCSAYGAYFHSDTVQTMGFFPIDVAKMKIHFLTGSAHKFHGPKGVGFLYLNGDVPLKPFIDGGSQERNMRGGTENVAGIVGMAKALDLALTNLEEKKETIFDIRNYLKNSLLAHFDDVQFVGDTEGVSHYKVLNVSFPPSPKAELLLFNLDISGISASGGSACSSGAEGGSHVLNALGVDESRKCIRFSFSHYNTPEDVDFLIEKLKTMTPMKAVAV